MKIIGRSHEQMALQKLLDSMKSEFLTIYGRRRVGKTFLIREFYKSHTVFRCSGINSNRMEDQLEVFYEGMLQSGLLAISPPSSWLEAFRALKFHINSLKTKKKKVIFLDEISWLDTPRARFVPALSHFWNTYCVERNDIILVVCGSVSTWITENVLNNRGELHNRSTKRIRLKPFSLYETESFLKHRRVSLSRKDIAQLYMLVGGIPYYLETVDPGKSIPQIMDDLFFGELPALDNEYENLYPALFKNSDHHISVVSALSKKNMGLTRQEILDVTGLKSGGSFTKVLTELESCGFIKSLQPIDKKKEDVLYRLMDEYSIFYHKYIKPKRITSGIGLGNTRSFNIWSGFTFENLCIRHSKHIAYALGISGTDWSIYSFKDKAKTGEGAQIDLILDRPDAINIIEAKYYNDVYKMSLSEARKIRNRVQSFLDKTQSKKSIFRILITPYGAKKNEHYLSEITNDLVIDDLYVDIAI